MAHDLVQGKAAGDLDKLKEKKQPKGTKAAHLHVACSHGSNHRIITVRTATTIKATDAIVTIANRTVAIQMIDAMTTHVAKSRTSKKGPTIREMICA